MLLKLPGTVCAIAIHRTADVNFDCDQHLCVAGRRAYPARSKESFSKTVSGVDLIVGARTGPLNLLLYSVFRIGSPTNNISCNSYRELRRSESSLTIPVFIG